MLTLVNWKRNSRCLRAHRLPVLDPDGGVVTSVALDADWLVAGLANHRIYVFFDQHWLTRPYSRRASA
jgi:F-box and WD-40 domain protein CDC4